MLEVNLFWIYGPVGVSDLGISFSLNNAAGCHDSECRCTIFGPPCWVPDVGCLMSILYHHLGCSCHLLALSDLNLIFQFLLICWVHFKMFLSFSSGLYGPVLGLVITFVSTEFVTVLSLWTLSLSQTSSRLCMNPHTATWSSCQLPWETRQCCIANVAN